jgi:hypothetical protein
MTKAKVHLEAHHHFYIHNDIGNAAFYFKTRVEERIAKGDRDGIGFEIMAGLTLLAFEVEARFNFLGAKLIADWNERKPLMEKIKKVCAHLGGTPDFSARPYWSVTKLKDFRDTLAHGKPQESWRPLRSLRQRGFCAPIGSLTSTTAFCTTPTTTVSRFGRTCCRKRG